MRSRLPAFNTIWVAALSAAFLLFLTNGVFWSKATAFFATNHPFLIGFTVSLYLLFFAVLLTLSAPYMLRPVYSLIFLIAAGAGYFTDTFGVMIDRDMIRNVAQTDVAESSQLMTSSYVIHMLLYGVLPCLLIWLIPIKRLRPLREVGRNTALILGSVVVAFGFILTHLVVFMPFWQREREVTMSYLNPVMAISSTVDYGLREYIRGPYVAAPYGTDAKLGPAIADAAHPTILVLVVGETARAQNFSLMGYKRDTNPELEAMDIVAFKHATSCGTSTAVSMPCMFSHLGHDGYSKNKAYSSENLVDVLKHAGLKVEWWENNTGPKGIADRIPTDMIAHNGPADLCEGGECLDEILARKLERVLPGIKDNTVLVLHTMGSHGPSYFKRYPNQYRKFRPDCRTPELTTCTPQELVNAYDNTVVYTDHMLARFIDILKSRTDASTALLYMSDHGESLGEDGLYLHGAPYDIAPDYQKKIPAIAWVSDGYAAQFKLDMGCAKAKGDAPVSHDNMFDTVLGLMDVKTSVYKAPLDLFSSCHENGVASN